MVAAGSSALLLSMWSLTRRSLPKLDGEELILSFPMETGFWPFLQKLTDELVAVGTPVDNENGLLRVFEGPSFKLLYEIPIQASPDAAVTVTPEHWACLLRPLRERRDREAEVLLVEMRTGKIVHREPLGSRWYLGHVSGGDGWLFATVQRSGEKRSVSGIRAFRLSPSH
jgi:hypothetical protein